MQASGYQVALLREEIARLGVDLEGRCVCCRSRIMGVGGAEAGRRLRGDQRHSGSEHGILCLELLEE